MSMQKIGSSSGDSYLCVEHAVTISEDPAHFTLKSGLSQIG